MLWSFFNALISLLIGFVGQAAVNRSRTVNYPKEIFTENVIIINAWSEIRIGGLDHSLQTSTLMKVGNWGKKDDDRALDLDGDGPFFLSQISVVLLAPGTI